MDENNRRMATNIRLQMTNLAESFVQAGEPDKGLEVMDLLLRSTPSRNVPFSRVMLPVVELLSEISMDETLSEADRARAAQLAKQVGSELFADLTDDVSYFISLEDEYYFASDNSIQMAMAVSQRIAGALQDALSDDPDVVAMGTLLTQLRGDNADRKRGQFSDSGAFNSEAAR